MSNCGFSLHWAGVFAWTASACTGPASSSDSASWTNRCRCKGLIPSKRELTTATRKCVSLPAGTAWPPLSLRSSSTSGLRACSNLARIAASTGPPAADPALPRDTHARVAMETMHRANRALSIRFVLVAQPAAPLLDLTTKGRQRLLPQPNSSQAPSLRRAVSHTDRGPLRRLTFSSLVNTKVRRC